MYTPGTIVYFTPFRFSDGSSKNKYFLVLATGKGNLLVASLPTSKDHVPRSMKKRHGCINDDAAQVNCYFFEAGRSISECGTFRFEKDTFVYGEQVTFVDMRLMQSSYREEGRDYRIACRLSNIEFQSVKDCLRSSSVVRNKFKRIL
jgi:hypothetical protein